MQEHMLQHTLNTSGEHVLIMRVFHFNVVIECVTKFPWQAWTIHGRQLPNLAHTPCQRNQITSHSNNLSKTAVLNYKFKIFFFMNSIIHSNGISRIAATVGTRSVIRDQYTTEHQHSE